MSEPLLVRVVAPHFVAGLVLDDAGIVRQAAPILKWTIGKPRAYLRADFAKRGWRAEVVQVHQAGEMETER